MTDLVLVAPLDGWAMPLAEVPDPVFAGGMMGAGVGIDPTGDTLYAPCDATVLTIHAAGHAVTLLAAGGAELLMHIGIDSVALKGAGFTPLVAPGDSVAAGDPLIRFDLDRLVTGASATATPVIVTGEGHAITVLAQGRLVRVGEPLLRVTLAAATDVTQAGDIIRREAVVMLPHGLHARPAARIVAAVRALEAEAWLVVAERRASCASAVSLLSLGLSHGSIVEIEARGPDAASAIGAIVPLLTAEVDAVPSPPVVVTVPTTDLPDGALAGVFAAPGLAIGPACRLRRDRPQPPEAGEGIAAERARLDAGLDAVRAALDAAMAAPGSAGAVFRAHREMVDDPDLLAAALAGIDAGRSAAAAFLSAAQVQAAQLRALGDRRIAERADDLQDVGERVAHAILGTAAATQALPDGAVLIAEDLLPSQFAALDPARLGGICLIRGGPTSHVAILAAGAGLPMLVAMGEALEGIADGTPLILDADGGFVLADPSADVTASATATIARRQAAETRARASAGARATTTDGVAVPVYANLGSAEDAAAALAAGADGSGLVRTEFLFLDRATPPSADEQAVSYAAVAAALPDRPIVIRLLDVGGDKPAPYLAIPAEENPALGLRGVRVSLARPELLEAQLAAILSLDARDRCRIMVPMIASGSELAAVRAVLDRLRGERGIGPIPLGAMVETPAAAIGADLIAAHADFLSIGSNDLTQYTLAMDRGNAAVAAGIDGLHPAVLRLIAATCEGGAARGVPVGVCGGLAAEPLAVPILLGLGVATLSVPPARVPAIKALVAGLSLARARDHARAAIACASSQEVRALARRFAEENIA